MRFVELKSVLDEVVFDVVVVGGGAAGLTAAVTAAREGASVVLLEAAGDVGGTTVKSGGGFWVPGNRLMRERGFVESRDRCLAHMALLTDPGAYDRDAERCGLDEYKWEMIVNYFDRAAAAIEVLEAEGDFSYALMESFIPDDDKPIAPWYVTEPDGEVYGRILVPTRAQSESVALEGAETDIFTARPRRDTSEHDLGEDDSSAFGGDPRAFYASDVTGDGFDMVMQLLRAALDRGVSVVVEHRVVDVLCGEDGAVVGVSAETPGGEVAIEARQGVVFASGGMEFNAELRERYLRGPIVGSCGAPTNRGDFVEIGRRVGAEFANMSEAWWGELPLEPCLTNFEAPTPNMPYVHGDSMVVVNRLGERVVNEKLSYNERGKVHFVRDEDGGYPNYLLFHVFDQAVVDDETAWVSRWQVPYGEKVPSHVLRAATLDELAAALEQRLAELSEQTSGFRLDGDFAEGLRRTIARFNEFARQGKDEDFGRGDLLPDQYYTPRVRSDPMPNHTMYPFRDTGPYYAVILGASTLGTKGGPKISPTSQVLRPDGTPIPGLYGAGNCIGSPAGEAYWGGGSTLGPAIVHGHLAGINVVKEPTHQTATPR